MSSPYEALAQPVAPNTVLELDPCSQFRPNYLVSSECASEFASRIRGFLSRSERRLSLASCGLKATLGLVPDSESRATGFASAPFLRLCSSQTRFARLADTLG